MVSMGLNQIMNELYFWYTNGGSPMSEGIEFVVFGFLTLCLIFWPSR
jgi:hypothetical protein